MDKNGNNKLDEEEIKYVLKMLGMAVNDNNVDAIWDELDKDDDGTITVPEFREAMAKWFLAQKK